MLLAVLSGFVVAIVAPWLPRTDRPATSWAIAALPLALTVYFATCLPAVIAGETFREAYPWVASLGVSLSLRMDGLGLLFALLISGIGTLIVVYSGAYMAGRERNGRFYAFLLAFMASMLGVVLADNLITLFLFWELTSLTSFVLIGYEHEREESRRAALQALLVTTASGLAMLAGLVMVGVAGGSFELSELASQSASIVADPWYGPAALLILLGAFAKSAQFPLHFWLPNAMEAPTPVSAYLHSSTMVKAGVYLVARLTPVLGGTALWHGLAGTVGAVTMLAGGYLALRSTEMKRILAYATVSILGLLMMLLGVGGTLAVTAAMVFLVVHAAYKGALFMAAGSITHATGQRDVRRLGGLARSMPITAGASLVVLASMAGLPPLFGFVGKELVYEAAWHGASAWPLVTLVALLGNAIGVAVAGHFAWRVFFGSPSPSGHAPHDGPTHEWIGPALLAALSLVAGLWPGLVAAPVAAAAASVQGEPVEAKLVLWHGLGAALVLDLITLALGGAMIVLYAGVLRATDRAEPLARFGPESWYDASVEGMNWLARWQTRVLQNGRLRYYLLTIVGAAVALTLATLAVRGGVAIDLGSFDVRLHELALAGLVLGAAIFVVRSRSRLAAITGLGVVGAGIALLFVLFGAPDLAMTQFVVEALVVILFVLVFYHLPRFTSLSSKRERTRDAVVALAAGAMMTLLLLGAASTPLERSVSQYYLARSVPDAHGRNVVNTILVDFRALDTLGEITVLAVAALGIYALVRLRPDGRPKP